MFTRNYDNIKALMDICTIDGTKRFALSTTFGDGHISFKKTDGTMYQYDTLQFSYTPLNRFYNGGNGNYFATNYSCDYLVCGYEEGEITYDDYKIDNLASGLKFVENSVSIAQVNENNEIVSTYTKIFCNTGSTDITINCIGVISAPGSSSAYGAFLVYKEKIPAITIAPKQNVVLTFTTKVPVGQNKPADYSASASV